MIILILNIMNVKQLCFYKIINNQSPWIDNLKTIQFNDIYNFYYLVKNMINFIKN